MQRKGFEYVDENYRVKDVERAIATLVERNTIDQSMNTVEVLLVSVSG